MPVQTIKCFIRLESSGGILLFLAAVLVLILDNSSLSYAYQALFHAHVAFQVGFCAGQTVVAMGQ